MSAMAQQDSSSTQTRSMFARTLLTLELALTLLLLLWAAYDVFSSASGLKAGMNRVVGLRLGALGAAALGGLAVAVRLVRRLPITPGLPKLRGMLTRGPAYALFGSLLTCSWWRHTGLVPAENTTLALSLFLSMTLALLAPWLLLLAFQEIMLRKIVLRMSRFVDLLLANAIVILLLFEGGTRLLARWYPSPLFWDQESVARKIQAVRWPPGYQYFDFRFNSRGYHDEEFFTAGTNDWVGVVLADSFGIGVVPYSYHFTRLAEQKLQQAWADRHERVALHNFGVAGTGMREYAYILVTEAMACRPNMVILCVFIGNDILEFDLTRKKTSPCFIQDWRSGQTIKRLKAILKEAKKQRGAAPAALDSATTATGAIPDYINDWHLEKPTFSDEAFLKIESDRVGVCDPQNKEVAPYYDAFFESLSFFGKTLGNKLLIVLIPDEFQVNDELYKRLIRPLPNRRDYDRDYPQKRIRAFCEERGWAVLDLLDDLRAAQKQGRVYHLNDTHWNSRGNRVAAEAIAGYILKTNAH